MTGGPAPDAEPRAAEASGRSTPGRALLASAFGLGLSPVLTGTCAALLGLAYHALLVRFAPGVAVPVGLAAGLLVSVVLNHRLTAFSVSHWGREDPSEFVWDEVAGYLVAALLTVNLPWWPFAPLAFGLFRVLDMLKVWPASWIDRQWHGAWGILLDDVVSAIYAAGLLQLAALQGWVGA